MAEEYTMTIRTENKVIAKKIRECAYATLAAEMMEKESWGTEACVPYTWRVVNDLDVEIASDVGVWVRKPIFFLGPDDFEMREIERVLKEAGETYYYAMHSGGRGKLQRVSGMTAYAGKEAKRPGEQGDELPVFYSPKPHDGHVFVHCNITWMQERAFGDPQLNPNVPFHATRLGHYRKNETGYGAYDPVKGSALGQILTYLKRKPTQEQYVMMACAHSISRALAGYIIDVSSGEAINFYKKAESEDYKVPLAAIEEMWQAAKNILERALINKNVSLDEAVSKNLMLSIPDDKQVAYLSAVASSLNLYYVQKIKLLSGDTQVQLGGIIPIRVMQDFLRDRLFPEVTDKDVCIPQCICRGIIRK